MFDNAPQKPKTTDRTAWVRRWVGTGGSVERTGNGNGCRHSSQRAIPRVGLKKMAILYTIRLIK